MESPVETVMGYGPRKTRKSWGGLCQTLVEAIIHLFMNYYE